MANENIIKANAEVLDLLLTCPIVKADADQGIVFANVGERLVLANVYNRSNKAIELMRNNLSELGLTSAKKLSPEAVEIKADNFRKLEECGFKGFAAEVVSCVLNGFNHEMEGEEVAVATVE
ncbi:MAG: hypothetical protein IJA61_00695 [Clostridia bacterium]|nr:hypothetical protein [Clostridia bacterium]